MKLGIMQPYFFPYIGYWQLMNAVDTYVIYDDVNFIKNGWINRNRILLNGQPHYFNLPTVGASSFVLINEVKLSPEKKLFPKLLKTLEAAYKKAPQYNQVMPLLEKIIMYPTDNMTELLIFHIREIAKYLNMSTKILISSQDVSKDQSLHAQDKVLDICKNLSATEYYNAIGGQELYDAESFQKCGVKLSFLRTGTITYPQYKNEFVGNLSIVDMMMFCSLDEIQKHLQSFELL